MTETVEHLNAILDLQRRACSAAPYPTFAERTRDLKALRLGLQRYQDQFAVAMSGDFGRRSHFESKFTDVLAPGLEIDYILRNLKKWMKPQKRSTDLLFKTNRASVHYQPKGVVGVIAPWNFPLLLAVGPLIKALAAGNRVMIKMSEFTPRTTEVFCHMLAEIFPEKQVAVFGGDVKIAQAFSRLPFDHLVFTGAPSIGKDIMRAAAENLTPLTLELGGKSPAIVSRTASLAGAARRIAHGKAFNSGQACVAPDYALVPREHIHAFVSATASAFRDMYPDFLNDPHYTSIATDRHADRIGHLLADAIGKGARVTSCGTGGTARVMSLQIVTGVTSDMRIAQEELFGPILVVLPYDTLDDAIRHITGQARPLALYYFGSDSDESERLVRDIHAGGMTINDWGWHAFQADMPFGGIGNSGMGSWRGPEGFRALSHAKSVFTEHGLFPVKLFHPPYGNLVQRLSLRFLLGKTDPSLPAPVTVKVLAPPVTGSLAAES